MSPTQTSGRDSFGWRLRCPFRYPPTLSGGAEDSYGIEDRDRIQIGSKIKGKAPGAEEAAREAEKRGESSARQGRSGQGGDQAGREGCVRRKAQARIGQAAGQQRRGDQGGRD